MESELGGRSINSQSREIISNVFTFMKQEASGVIIPLNCVQERVASATGVSERTVNRICNEKKKILAGEYSKFPTPKKSRNRGKPITDISDSDKKVLNQLIKDLYKKEGKPPSINTIREEFKKCTGFNGSRESMRKLIHNLGYRWGKDQKYMLKINDDNKNNKA